MDHSNLALEAKQLHTQAWNNSAKFDEYLEQAIEMLTPAIQAGTADDAARVNYAAILLDLEDNGLALEFLGEAEIACHEYYANRAIAVAKLNRQRTDEIQRWNDKAAKAPELENTIIAYMNWQL